MNYEKFTKKAAQALNNTATVAAEYGNQEVGALHLLYALLSDDEGLIPSLLEACKGKKI